MDVGLLLKNQVSNTELKFSYDTDLENGTYDCQGRRIGEGIVREFGTDTYTLLHFALEKIRLGLQVPTHMLPLP